MLENSCTKLMINKRRFLSNKMNLQEWRDEFTVTSSQRKFCKLKVKYEVQVQTFHNL